MQKQTKSISCLVKGLIGAFFCSCPEGTSPFMHLTQQSRIVAALTLGLSVSLATSAGNACFHPLPCSPFYAVVLGREVGILKAGGEASAGKQCPSQ